MTAVHLLWNVNLFIELLWHIVRPEGQTSHFFRILFASPTTFLLPPFHFSFCFLTQKSQNTWDFRFINGNFGLPFPLFSILRASSSFISHLDITGTNDLNLCPLTSLTFSLLTASSVLWFAKVLSFPYFPQILRRSSLKDSQLPFYTSDTHCQRNCFDGM